MNYWAEVQYIARPSVLLSVKAERTALRQFWQELPGMLYDSG
jgi:hypothetical protein